jgi:hypothetical protein
VRLGILTSFLSTGFLTNPETIAIDTPWGSAEGDIGADIIGTPLMPEVILAREAEMCFASTAPIINYASGLASAVLHTGSGSMVDFNYPPGT